VLAAENRPGLCHIAFAVSSIAEAHAQVVAAGGSSVGDVICTRIAPDIVVTWCYVRDPEGNIVELQSHSQDPDV
jgi:predicted enzyme related to lactoylglutathione lyase